MSTANVLISAIRATSNRWLEAFDALDEGTMAEPEADSCMSDADFQIAERARLTDGGLRGPRWLGFFGVC